MLTCTSCTGHAPLILEIWTSLCRIGILFRHGELLVTSRNPSEVILFDRLAMQGLPRGRARNIGVANFDVTNLQVLVSHSSTKVIPAVNQIELHPYNPTPKLVAYCKKLGIQCVGYSPLGSRGSTLIHNPIVLEIAGTKRRTPQQILLMWGLQNGWGVIPGSFSKDHINSNFDLDGWWLSEKEMNQLSTLETKVRVYTDMERMRLPSRVFLDEEVSDWLTFITRHFMADSARIYRHSSIYRVFPNVHTARHLAMPLALVVVRLYLWVYSRDRSTLNPRHLLYIVARYSCVGNISHWAR